MNPPNNALNEVFARLSMLEFVVEIIVANNLACHEPEQSKAWKTDFLQRFDVPILGPAPTTTEAEQTEAWIAERSTQMAKRLMERVGDPEAGIREHHRGMGA